MGISDFVAEHGRRRDTPKDQFGHAAYLLDSENPINPKDVEAFSHLISKEIKLGNIDSDKMLMLHQETAGELIHFLDMARRDNNFVYPFYVLYYKWVAELALTRTKDGMERELQAEVGGGQYPKELGGYGSELYETEEGGESKASGLMNKIGATIANWRNQNKGKYSGGFSKRMK